MKVSYFPGCTLRTKAKELDRCARACAEILGFELCEIENWQCCGGYTVMDDPNTAAKRSRKVYGSACIHGADEIVTACPLCRYNLVKNGMGEEASVPVVYFTELMAEAFGIKNGAANGSAAGEDCGCAVNGEE